MTQTSKSWVGKWAVIFIITMSASFFLSEARLFQKFMPRSVCMFGNQKLIWMHFFSDMVIFLSYTGIPLILMGIWRHFKIKGIPFADFFWKFAGFIFFCGLTHFLGMLNLFVTYYWLDGLLKLMTAWFSVLVLHSLFREAKKIKNVQTPEEYDRLSKTLKELIEQISAVSVKKVA